LIVLPLGYAAGKEDRELQYFREAKDFGHKRDEILLLPIVCDQENLHGIL
jgi:hypothetical protein